MMLRTSIGSGTLVPKAKIALSLLSKPIGATTIPLPNK